MLIEEDLNMDFIDCCQLHCVLWTTGGAVDVELDSEPRVDGGRIVSINRGP